MLKATLLAAALAAASLAAGTAHAGSPGLNFQPTGAGNAFKFQLELTGPSFNCNYAKAPDEVVICQDPELSRLDRETARLYSEVMNYFRGSDRNQAAWLRRSQAAWLNSRHRCGYDKDCIKETYVSRSNRLAYLNGID